MYPSEKEIAAYSEKYKAIVRRNKYKKLCVHNERPGSNLEKLYKSVVCRIGINLEKLGLELQDYGTFSYKS